MIIRQATLTDLKQIADVHIQCFPDSFSTQLGKAGGGYLQQQFYREYMNSAPELFLVAEETNKIIGFCMGYYCEDNGQIQRYFKNNRLRILIRTARLLLLANKQAWAKLWEAFQKKSPFHSVNPEIKFSSNEAGDLLSICVLPQYRGNGAAQQLIERYEQVLLKHGRKMCKLTVDLSNERGVRFYERNGYVPHLETDDGVRAYLKMLK